MLYKVKAKPIQNELPAFYEVLTNGTVQNQTPDGEEIVASMKRAKITSPGVIEWYETCYCPTPLRHERATVYDRVLSSIEAQPVEELGEIEGESFWDWLENLAETA